MDYSTSRIFLIISLFCPVFLAAQFSPSAQLEQFQVQADTLPPATQCLTFEERENIRENLQKNVERLSEKGKITMPGKSVVKFGWPLKQANNFTDPGYYVITNYVDHHPLYNGNLLDYNCGRITYDTDNYNHKGIDIGAWPFGWHKLDNNQVEIVSVAAGTIIGKNDGNYDENCSLGGGAWNAVYIRHDDGSTSWYGHMKRNSLTNKPIGGRVAKGEYLGVVGSSGNSTGPHLHLEVYDKDGKLVDPYGGYCNMLNGLDSRWERQLPYYDSGINKLMTHSAMPVYGNCNARTIINEENEFQPGDKIFFGLYLRHVQQGQTIHWEIFRPDNSLYESWDQVIDNTQLLYNWQVSKIMQDNAPMGKWRVRVTYGSQTESHEFQIGSEGVAPGCELMNTDCSAFLSGTWEGVFQQYSCDYYGSYAMTIVIEKTDGCQVEGYIYYPQLPNSGITRIRVIGYVDPIKNKLILEDDGVLEGGSSYLDNGIYEANINSCRQLEGFWRRKAIGVCGPDVLENGAKYLLNKNTGTPDLTHLPTSSTVTVNGSQIDISVKVYNDGTGDAQAGKLKYYLSSNTVISTSDHEIGIDLLPALSPGESSEETLSLDICSLGIVPDGNYFIGFLIDPEDDIKEIKEDNNKGYWNAPQLNLSCESQNRRPNLRCDELGSLSSHNNTLTLSGLKIINDGTGNAGSSHIGYYLSTNTTISKSDIFLGEDYVTSLSPGSSSTESFSSSLAGITPGTYYLGIIVDYQEEVGESNGDDNTCYYTNPRVIIKEEEAATGCACTSTQATVICDNFQSYDTGRLGPQSACWTTWSGSEGGEEDGLIGQTDDGNKYLIINGTEGEGGPQDVVLQLGNRTSGAFNLSFRIFLYSGDKGYYNILHEFQAGPGADQWAQEVYFDGYGEGYLRTGGQQYPFSYTTDQWIEVNQFINIDENITALNIDGNYVHEWPFSYQAGSSSGGTKMISAIDFYPPDQDHLLFVDNILFEPSYIIYGGNPATKLPTLAAQAAPATTTSTQVKVFPNPAHGPFEVRIESTGALEAGHLEVINTKGQIVKALRVPAGPIYQERITLVDFTPGIYLVRYTSEKSMHTARVVLLE